MKKPTKITLALELSGIAALAFGFVSFLGLHFLNIDTEKVWGMPTILGSITQALAISLILFVLSFGAQLLKRSNRNIKISMIGEAILIILFMIAAVFLVLKESPFNHFFTVTKHKSAINEKLQASIIQAENMFADYEQYANIRLEDYKMTLNSVINGKYRNPTEYRDFGFQDGIGVTDSAQAEYKRFILQNNLFPSNYTDSLEQKGIKEVASKWLMQAKATTNGLWRPIGIVSVVTDIEDKSNEWLSSLNSFSQYNEYPGPINNNYDYELSFEDVKVHFTKKEEPTIISIGLAAFTYILILFPWFISKRGTRGRGGVLMTKSYEVVL